MATAKKTDWDSILATLEEGAKRRRTIDLPADWTLDFDREPENCRLRLSPTEELGFAHGSAVQSLTRQLRAPLSYLRRLEKADAQQNVDILRPTLTARLKARVEETKQGLVIRAIVKSRLADVSDLEVAQSVRESAPQDLVPELFDEGDKFTHLRLIDLSRYEVGKLPDGKPDVHSYGLDVVMTELGWQPFVIDQVGWRQVCTNGMVVRTNLGVPFFKRAYSGLNRERVQAGVGAVAPLLASYRDVYYKKLAASKDIKIPPVFRPGALRAVTPEFADEVAKMLGVRKVSDKVAMDLGARVAAEGGGTVYDLANALTLSAHGAANRNYLELRAADYLSTQVAMAA